jgi:hypothetical protein
MIREIKSQKLGFWGEARQNQNELNAKIKAAWTG